MAISEDKRLSVQKGLSMGTDEWINSGAKFALFLNTGHHIEVDCAQIRGEGLGDSPNFCKVSS